MSSTTPGEAGPTSPTGAFTRGDAPARIGPYRIVAPLGEGGMGVVYLAEQTEPVHREVAIKLLRDGADSHGVIARFQTERQALAVMDHPGITKVFDAGTTDAGWPYFVMERVHGTSVTEYAATRRLDLRARLVLFMQICHAVHHAHQKGIIHRDLKPSNVLVTDTGDQTLCKVIDFGIAKALEPSPDRQPLTATGLAIGTPAYMSPEQGLGSGLDIDTRTDIYSLGVLLYELLAGVPPYDARSMGHWAIMVQHAAKEAPAPSARFAALPPAEQQRFAEERGTTPAALRRDLHGDLDAIVLKALEKEREQRYGSAAAFAADVAHSLAHEPVDAATASGIYRARKFARRHRVGVAFAATVALLVVVFAVAATAQAERLARARRVAVARQGQAEQLVGYMLGDLRVSLAPIGRLDVLDGVAKKALAYFAAVPEGELSNEEVFRRTVALRQLGEVQVEREQLPQAMEVFGRSLGLADELARRDATVTEWQVGLGASHFWVGYIHYERGELAQALTHFVPYLAISEALVARHPDSLAFRLELAQATSNIGSTREAQGDLAGALDAFQRAVTIKRELVRRDSTRLDWRLDLSHSYNTLAVIQHRLGRLTLAAQNHRVELELRQSLVARDAGNADYARYLTFTQSFLGHLLVQMGQVDDGLVLLRDAYRGYQRLTARDSTNAMLRMYQANTERLVGYALMARGDSAGSERALAHGVDQLRTLMETNAPSRTLRNQLARGQASLGEVRSRLGRGSEALRDVAAAVAIAKPAFENATGDLEQREVLADVYLAQGNVLARAGRATEARAAWTAASRLIDSVALATGETALLVSAATARLHLGDVTGATPTLHELLQRGYRGRGLLALAREKGAPIAP